MPDRITIVEVGPRDGLQNKSAPVPAAVTIDTSAGGLGGCPYAGPGAAPGSW